MKKIFSIASLVVMISMMASCTKQLEELNINRTDPTTIDPTYQLNLAILNTSYPGSVLQYEVSIVQQMVTPNGGVLAGANFNQDNRPATIVLWQTYYRNVIRNTHDVIVRTKSIPAKSNLYNMARIIQAYAFMMLTDAYGDIPYTEGGAGYSDQIFYPKYDTQQSIYENIIKELTEASTALNASGTIETSDMLYNGNVAQWKKFGYSLLLRAGMRLSKANAALAQTTVLAAYNGGVILTNADNAAVRHDANNAQPIGNTLNTTEAANLYLAKPFVDQLKNTNDPRLSAIAIRYVGAKSGPEQTPAVGSTDPTKQIGMPIGKDNGTIGAAATADGLVSFYEYSQVDRRRMASLAAPVYFVTAAQTNLLLAEARQRNWITAGTVQGYYEAGITAHMQQMGTYPGTSAIAAGDIATYLTNNPFDPANALAQINTQYWIASFLNGPEAFANFRRSGFPVLTANPYVGEIPAGTFIRRLTYPSTEISVNNANVGAAIAKQGADNLATRVYWDK